MYQFFTAKVGKLIEAKDGAPLAFLQLEPDKQQDAKPRVKAALVLGVPTQGKSRGQLLQQGDDTAIAHLVFDIGFVLRLEPGRRLLVEWDARSGGRVMTNILATAIEK